MATQCASTTVAPPGAGLLHHVMDEARLPDPGFADHEHGPAPLTARPHPPITEHLQLSVTAHQAARRTCHRRHPNPADAP
jgi:hypothetical protein